MYIFNSLYSYMPYICKLCCFGLVFREQIIKQSTELVCRAYSELYAAVMDPSNEYKDPETILHRSPHQVQALLS